MSGRVHIAFWALAIVAGLSAARGATAPEPSSALPPLLAESDERPAPRNPALLAHCLPAAQEIVDRLHFVLGPPSFTHSAKWGDLVRLDVVDTKKGLASRIACSATDASAGVTPMGEPLPVPPGMRGVWAIAGKCTDKSRWLVMTATTMKPGTGDAFEVRYFTRYGTSGHGVLWSTQGSWHVPQYDTRLDAMLWSNNSGTARFLRCPIAQ